MNPAAALVLALLARSNQGASIFVSGALSHPDAPANTPDWREGSVGWNWNSPRWHAGMSATSVRRWDLDDLQGEMRFGRFLSEMVSWESTASIGRQELFLPSWSIGSELSGRLGRGWVGTIGMRIADFRGWTTATPRVLLEHYLGPWRLGAGSALAWPEGLGPVLDARALAGFDWSDRGGIGLDASYAREAERDGGRLVDRRSLSVSMGARQGIGSRLVLRPALAWTRLEDVHDRLEVRLGMECGFGG